VEDVEDEDVEEDLEDDDVDLEVNDKKTTNTIHIQEIDLSFEQIMEDETDALSDILFLNAQEAYKLVKEIEQSQNKPSITGLDLDLEKEYKKYTVTKLREIVLEKNIASSRMPIESHVLAVAGYGDFMMLPQII
jgi:uncharacterized protein YfbU (UPF0304 family)